MSILETFQRLLWNIAKIMLVTLIIIKIWRENRTTYSFDHDLQFHFEQIFVFKSGVSSWSCNESD